MGAPVREMAPPRPAAMSDWSYPTVANVCGSRQEMGMGRALSPATRDAVTVLGQLIASERRRQRRPAVDLAERAGISRDTL